MSVVKLEPKSKKPDLMVSYLDKEYVLPGHITASMMESMFEAQEKDGDDGFLKMFLSKVVPVDFKNVISQDDLAQLAKIWMEYIQAPKDSGSTK